MIPSDILFASIVPGCFLVASVAIAAVVRGEGADEHTPAPEPSNLIELRLRDPDDFAAYLSKRRRHDYVSAGMGIWRDNPRKLRAWMAFIEDAHAGTLAYHRKRYDEQQQRQNGGQP